MDASRYVPLAREVTPDAPPRRKPDATRPPPPAQARACRIFAAFATIFTAAIALPAVFAAGRAVAGFPGAPRPRLAEDPLITFHRRPAHGTAIMTSSKVDSP